MTDTPTPKIVRAQRDSDTTSPFGVAQWLLYGEDTAGAFSLAIATVDPGGGPPVHVHQREDETYVVLSGTVEVTIDDRVETLGTGDCVFFRPASRTGSPTPDPSRRRCSCWCIRPGLSISSKRWSASGRKGRQRGRPSRS